jgi:hypothetical protein
VNTTSDLMTIAIIGAAVAVYSWKLMGHLVPARLTGENFRKSADALTIALLAALVGVQGFTLAGNIAFDERVVALTVAAGLLLLRAPFIVVVVVAAAVAALLRMIS